MRQLFIQTPHARVLVLCPYESRVETAAVYFRGMGFDVAVMGKDRPQTFQILVGTPDTVRKDLRFVGFIDHLVVDDCANMVRIIGSKKYETIFKALDKLNPSMKLHVYSGKPPLGIDESSPVTWKCGIDPLPVRMPVTGLRIAHGNGKPACGASNRAEHYFCRQCGRFRGFAL